MSFSLTTKWKIIVGFVVMILLAGGVTAIGYHNLSQATDSFMEYRRMAGLNVLTSDLLAREHSILSAINRFRISADPELMKGAMWEIKHSRRLVGESKNLAVGGKNLNALEAVERLIADQGQTGNALEMAITPCCPAIMPVCVRASAGHARRAGGHRLRRFLAG